jgi:branched-subunit amino acid permease
MSNKIAKTKEWIKGHKEEIATTTFVAGVAVFYVGLIAVSLKAIGAYNTEADKLRQDVADAISNGAQLLPGPNGSWWIIEETKS